MLVRAAEPVCVCEFTAELELPHRPGRVGVAIGSGGVIWWGLAPAAHPGAPPLRPPAPSPPPPPRHFPWPRALAYWSAQFVGAVCAAALLRASLGYIAHVGA